MPKMACLASLWFTKHPVESGSGVHSLPELFEAHRIINLSGDEAERISDQVIKSYSKGIPLNDIVKQTGKARSTVRGILIRAGISLRPNVSLPISMAIKKSIQSNIRPYYGFCYFQARIVADPRETFGINAHRVGGRSGHLRHQGDPQRREF